MLYDSTHKILYRYNCFIPLVLETQCSKTCTTCHITTPIGEILTATDLLQCDVDSSLRLHFVDCQAMRKVEWNTFLDSCIKTVCNLRRIAEIRIHSFPEVLKLSGFFTNQLFVCVDSSLISSLIRSIVDSSFCMNSP